MLVSRRTLLATGTAAAAGIALPRAGTATEFAPRPGPWRQFELTTRVALAEAGPAQVWVPVPGVTEPGWAEAGEVRWTGNCTDAVLVRDEVSGLRLVHAVWDEGTEAPSLDVIARAGARDRAADLSAPVSPPPLTSAERTYWTAPTMLIPTDGIVRETAERITAGATDDLAMARMIYDWIVAETERNPETRGCGLGDIATMLEVGDLTGKCADLNALFVGLARAAGLPARDVYGLRVAPSAFGYKSLGAKSADVTKAQHCRAEVHLADHGWIAADPADVRKVMLEEPPGNLDAADPMVVAARRTLFGAWEGNWIALNFAHDVELPGADGAPVPFLMYPEAEIAGRRLDPLDPEGFAYGITVREIG